MYICIYTYIKMHVHTCEYIHISIYLWKSGRHKMSGRIISRMEHLRRMCKEFGGLVLHKGDKLWKLV